MLDLTFHCAGARPAPWLANPTLLFDLVIEQPSPRTIYGIALNCQIRLEPARRRYAPGEQAALSDLFGAPHRWGDTLKPMQLSAVSLMVPGFASSTHVDVAVPCTYDTEVAATKYFRALDDGEIPLLLLFSGAVYYAGGDGLLVEPVPWDCETSFRLPVQTWRELMEHHFPGSGWLRVGTDALAALVEYRRRRMLTSWDETFTVLLAEAQAIRT